MAANIREKILKEYGIDIDVTDLLKLYKISDPKTDKEKLETLFQEAHDKFVKQSNSTMDEVVKRGREALEKEAVYQEILKKKDYIEKICQYKNQAGKEENKEKTAAAREYFSVIKESKKIQKNDIIFFYDYFYDQRKYKNEISEFLIKECGVAKAEVERAGKKGSEDTGESEEKKKENSDFCVTFCDRQTLILLKKAQDSLRQADWTEKVKGKCRETGRRELYDFLDLSKWTDCEQFQAYIDNKRVEIDRYAKESHDFDPLLDLYNTVSRAVNARDFSQNFGIYKTVIQFQDLAPFLFAIEGMTKGALSGLYRTARQHNYNFIDTGDLLLNYFLPVYQNFGIDIHGIRSEIKRLEHEKYKRKVMGVIDKVVGRKKETYLPFWKNLLFLICYFPFLMMFLVFETVKFIAYHIRYLAFVAAPLVIADLMFYFWTWMVSSSAGVHLFSRNGRMIAKMVLSGLKSDFAQAVYLMGGELYGGKAEFTSSTAITMGILVIAIELFAAVIPGILVGTAMWKAAAGMQKKYDWIGTERTLLMIYENLRKNFKTKKVWKALIPMLVYIIVGTCLFTGHRKLSGMGHSLADNYTYWAERQKAEETVEEAETEGETEAPHYETMVITAGAANIRTGAGTDYGIILAAPQGTVFEATGNMSQSGGGSVWYEIFLDSSHTETGWASEKVIAPQ